MRSESDMRIWQRDSVILFVICVAAFAIRLYRLVAFTAVIENEGPFFVRLATNLLGGKGYLGMAGIPDLSYAPLYPILIAAATPFTKSPELAGRIVSVLFGSLLVLPMYFLARQLYGRNTALVCATLTALHPVLIAYSAAVYNETVYLVLLAAGECAALYFLRLSTLKWEALTGLFFGLAYLTRPEAMFFPLLAVLAVFLLTLLRKGNLKSAALGSAVLLVFFGAFAAGYVAFLSSHTGKLSFQTKGKLNYTIGKRFSQGMPYDQASSGIRDDLTIEGPFLDPMRYSTYTPYGWTPPALIKYLFTMAKRNVSGVESLLTGIGFGEILFGLAVLGLFREAWDEWVSVANLFLVANLLLISAVILQVHLLQFRYVIPFYPFFILWASHGVIQLADWTKSTFKSASVPGGTATAQLFLYGAIALLLVSATREVKWNSEIQEGGAENSPAKVAGSWLGQHSSPGMAVMTAGDSTVPFYAGGTLSLLPYTESAVALRYIQSKNPSFVVLNSTELGKRPYLRDWLQHGIPDSHATIVYDSGGNADTRIAIYQWHPSRD